MFLHSPSHPQNSHAQLPQLLGQSTQGKAHDVVKIPLQPGDEQSRQSLNPVGPGFVQRNIRSGNQVQQVQEKEVRFIFDQDVYSTGKVKVAAVAETLNALHAHSDSVFSDAITTVLHDAMEPEYL